MFINSSQVGSVPNATTSSPSLRRPLQSALPPAVDELSYATSQFKTLVLKTPNPEEMADEAKSMLKSLPPLARMSIALFAISWFKLRRNKEAVAKWSKFYFDVRMEREAPNKAQETGGVQAPQQTVGSTS